MVSPAASLLEEDPSEIQGFLYLAEHACVVCIAGDVSHTNTITAHQENITSLRRLILSKMKVKSCL